MPITFPPPAASGATPDPLVPPSGNGTGSIGAIGNRWLDLRVINAIMEDLHMFRDGIRNTVIETPDGMVICDRNTGIFRRVLTEVCAQPDGWEPSDGQSVILPPETSP